MTSPVNVGSVAVDLVIEAKDLAKAIRKECEQAFKGLKLSDLIRNSIGNTKITLPVKPDVDTQAIPEKIRRTRAPKVPVEVDPLLDTFRQDVRRQVTSLARQVNANIPVSADTTGLRTELGARLKAIAAQSRIAIPTEPAEKAEYEARLRAMVASVAARVKANVKVDADTKGLSGITRLFQSFTPNLGGLSSAIQGVVQGLGTVVSLGGTAGSALGGIAAAAGPIGAVVAAIVAAATAVAGLSVAATVAGPALLAVAGAAAAIPAALSGLGAAVATLGLGFRGVADAFKPKAGGGGGAAGSAVNQARQVAAAGRQVEAARRGIAAANRGLEAAERGYTNALAEEEKAQARVRLAQQAVSRARREAVEDIEDLNRSLRGARLSEEEATLGVTDALRELNQVKLTGNIPDIQRADIAYRQALQTLDEAKDTTADLAERTDAANKAGVDGSDKVQAALRDQADAADGVRRAQEGVLDAQNSLLGAQDGLKSATDGLKSAQDSLAQAQQKVAAGGAAAAAQMVKLAPNAQRFVDAIKALKPAFESLRLDVQQRLFAGLDRTVTSMWQAWEQQLRATLGSFATTINGFLRDLGSALSTPEFIAGFAAGAEGFRRAFEQIGAAVTSKLIPAFGSLSKAAGPFLSSVGRVIADLVADFSKWIRDAERSGTLADFFDRAAKAFKSISTTGGLVAQILGDVFAILTGADPNTGKSALDSLNSGLQKVHEFLSDPQNQQQLRDFVGDLKDGLVKFGEATKQVKDFLDGLGGQDKGTSAGEEIGKAVVAGILAGIGQAMESGLDKWMQVSPFGRLITWVKDLFGIKSPSTVFAEIGRNLIAGLLQGITEKLTELRNRAVTIKNTVTGALSGAGQWLYTHGRTVVTGIGTGISSMLGTLRTRAANMRVTVQNALSGAERWLYEHGRAVISGLMNGIQSMFSSLAGFLGGVGSFIQDHKGPLDADRKLLVGAGRAIMGGLISGISAEKSALAAELADVTSIVAGVSLPSLGVDSAALTGSLAVAEQRSLVASWKSGVTVDPVLRAFQDLIDLQYGGDVQGAFSRT